MEILKNPNLINSNIKGQIWKDIEERKEYKPSNKSYTSDSWKYKSY